MSELLEEEIRILRTNFWSPRDPDGRAFAPLADAYRRKGELEEAHLLVQDGLSRHPDFATGHLIAARVARDRGSVVEAREHFDRVLDLDERNVLARVERAGAAEAEGDREGALEDLRAALQIEPGNSAARERLEALEDGGGWQPEAANIREAKIPDSEGAIVTRTMGDLYARQGFRDQAIEVYEHLLEEDPEDEDLVRRLAELRAPPGESFDGAEPGPAPREPLEVQDAPEDIEGAADALPDADTIEAGQTEPEEEETQLIASYFEDLLAWVPGAVPIESLAPGGPLPEEGQDGAKERSGEVADASTVVAPTLEPAEEEPHPVLPSATGGDIGGPEPVSTTTEEADEDDDEDGLDEFNNWLKGLQS